MYHQEASIEERALALTLRQGQSRLERELRKWHSLCGQGKPGEVSPGQPTAPLPQAPDPTGSGTQPTLHLSNPGGCRGACGAG